MIELITGDLIFALVMQLLLTGVPCAFATYHWLLARDLLRAIKEHHAQKADDRCWMDDNILYDAAGLPAADRRVGDTDAMLTNCRRFLENRCEGGGWPSYAQLEAECERLRGLLLETRHPGEG